MTYQTQMEVRCSINADEKVDKVIVLNPITE
jgi:hypothetical protein